MHIYNYMCMYKLFMYKYIERKGEIVLQKLTYLFENYLTQKWLISHHSPSTWPLSERLKHQVL